MVKAVDVDFTGVGTTRIGLYHLNRTVHDFLGGNMAWYKISQITGFISLAAAGIFAIVGIYQLIKRKNLFKVDNELLTLGCLYILTGSIYVLFEKVIINYRPVIMTGESAAEASFPSSHTMLSLVIMGSIFMIIDKYVRNQMIANIIKALCAAIAVITVIGRLLSGVHWLTDILGGILLSVCLLSLFSAIIKE